MSMTAIEHEDPRRDDDTQEGKPEVGDFRADVDGDSSEFETVPFEGPLDPIPEASRILGVAPHRANREPGSGAVPRRVLMPGPRILFHTAAAAAGDRPGSNTFLSYHDATQEFQRFFILSALERNGWNVAQTARMIKIQRSHLYKIIKAHKLVRPKKRRAGCSE